MFAVFGLLPVILARSLNPSSVDSAGIQITEHTEESESLNALKRASALKGRP
jgi:hypothetical protein